MSRHYHVSANSVASILRDISRMTTPEIENAYGIRVNSNGSVYDTTYNRTFDTVESWAKFNVDQDEAEFSERFGHGKMTHDDYY